MALEVLKHILNKQTLLFFKGLLFVPGSELSEKHDSHLTF